MIVLEPVNLPVFIERTCGHSDTQPGGGQLCLSLHFLRVQTFKCSQRWELSAFSGLSWTYAQPWACIQPWACTWPSRFPGICWSFSESIGTSYSPAFSLPQLLPLPVELFLTNTHPREKGFYTLWAQRSNKNSSASGCSLENHDIGQIMTALLE